MKLVLRGHSWLEMEQFAFFVTLVSSLRFIATLNSPNLP